MYIISNHLLYSVLIIPNINYKIYNYYISNHYMFYDNDKYITQIDGIYLYSKQFNSQMNKVLQRKIPRINKICVWNVQRCKMNNYQFYI